MSEQLSPEERYDLATKLIVQSPPGQVNDVIAAIQIIVDDNTPEFKQHVLSRLREYHQTQLQSVTLDGSSTPTLISSAAIAIASPKEEAGDVREDRYIDPRSKQSFKLDHFTLKTTDFLPYEIKPEFETFRTELQTALAQYIAAHYPSSEAVGSVFCSARPVVRKEASQSEAPAAVGAESVGLLQGEVQGQGQGQGEKKEVEDESKTSGIATTQPEDKSDPDLPAEIEIGEGIVQKEEDSTTVSDPAAGNGIDIPAPPPNSASAEPTSASSSVDPAADPSASTGTGTETSETGILAAANSAVAAVSETVETVKEALSAEVPVGGVAGLESEKPEGSKTETERGNDVAKPDQEEAKETKAEVAEEPVQEAQEEEEEDPSYTICIVSNKYNTNNFWTGRWRSVWTVDPKADKLHGEVFVDVHYFEAGNVQLSTTQTFDLPLPPAESGRAGKIVNGIAKLEAEYQLKLAETNQQFGDKEFRSLRRALPITRTRVDWDKVSAYRLRSKA